MRRVAVEFDFDKTIVREGTSAVKFDGRKEYFGTSDVTPLWVADMDFAVPPCVHRALMQRMEHPVLGYTLYPNSLYESIVDWFQYRHAWKIEREWILMAPGVVPSLFAAVRAFTQEGEGVIVQPPVYFPFFSSVTTANRRLMLNPLRLVDGKYAMDVAQLESCAKQGAKLLLLCTPHNPVGRVWSESELQEILRITRQYNVTILSDDIHADLTYSEVTHTMLGRLANADDKIITAIAPNKTFNIPGLGLSALIIPNHEQRRAVKREFDALHVSNTNPFSIVAFEAAYRDGAAWLNALMNYLQDTRDFAAQYIAQYIPRIKLIKPEATYLLWLDCRELGMTDLELRHFFVSTCKLGMNPGAMFGEGGSGFMRMNIGVRKTVIEAALSAIAKNL